MAIFAVALLRRRPSTGPFTTAAARATTTRGSRRSIAGTCICSNRRGAFDTGEKGGIQTNPLIVGRTLYAYTPGTEGGRAGRGNWQAEVEIRLRHCRWTQPARGVTYWNDGKHGRIFAGVMNFLYCLDAANRQAVSRALARTAASICARNWSRGVQFEFSALSIALTTPGIIYKDLIIVGGREPETHPAPPGDIRAFDRAHRRSCAGVFHTIPHPGEPGYETWPADAWKTAGAANNWAGMALDAKRGIVYVPTGSAVIDFYGGDRVGDDLYANYAARARREHRQAAVAFSGRASRHMGSRFSIAAGALQLSSANGKTYRRAGADHQAGLSLPLSIASPASRSFPIHEHPYPPSTVPGRSDFADAAQSPSCPSPLPASV